MARSHLQQPVTSRQAKAKIGKAGKIGSIVQTRADCGVDTKTGEPTLTAIFPRKDGRAPHHVDMRFLLAFPNLQPMFTEAFLSWGAGISPNSRRECRGNLRRYFSHI